MALLPNPPTKGGRELVAVTLAIGVSTALNIIVIAVLYDALFSTKSGLSNNATQILTGWGGGIIGVVGSYLGYRAGAAANGAEDGGLPEPDLEDDEDDSGAQDDLEES